MAKVFQKQHQRSETQYNSYSTSASIPISRRVTFNKVHVERDSSFVSAFAYQIKHNYQLNYYIALLNFIIAIALVAATAPVSWSVVAGNAILGVFFVSMGMFAEERSITS